MGLPAQLVILAIIALEFVSVRMELTVHLLMVSVTAQLAGMETFVKLGVQTIRLVIAAHCHVTVAMEESAIHSQDIAGL